MKTKTAILSAMVVLALPSAVMGQAVFINENFDGVVAPALPAGWSSTSDGSLAATPWVTATDFFNSAPNAAKGVGAAAVGNSYITLPSFVADGNVVLDFSRRFSMETGFDGVVVEASYNGGAFANIGSGAFTLNGYAATAISVNFQSPIGGQNAFTGTAAGFQVWTQSTATIPSANNDTVVLRFHLASDNSVTSIGFWLDNVTVTSIPAPGALALLGLAGLVGTRRRRRA